MKITRHRHHPARGLPVPDHRPGPHRRRADRGQRHVLHGRRRPRLRPRDGGGVPAGQGPAHDRAALGRSCTPGRSPAGAASAPSCGRSPRSTRRSGTSSGSRSARRSTSCSAASRTTGSGPTTPAAGRSTARAGRSRAGRGQGPARGPVGADQRARGARPGAARRGHHGDEDLAVRPVRARRRRALDQRRRPASWASSRSAGSARRSATGSRSCSRATATGTCTTAKRIAAAVEEYRPAWLEDMVLAHDVDAIAELKASTSTPVIASEMLITRYQYRQLLERRAADIVMVDPTWAGGITESRKIVDPRRGVRAAGRDARLHRAVHAAGRPPPRAQRAERDLPGARPGVRPRLVRRAGRRVGPDRRRPHPAADRRRASAPRSCRPCSSGRRAGSRRRGSATLARRAGLPRSAAGPEYH